ncbi:MAG: SlyX family protein [Geobacter sp.]|nr:SlyX family protein [Geobacter sp.]
MEQRLTDIETHFMHLDRSVQELNDVVYRQQQTIDRLEKELREMREQFLVVAPSLVRAPEDEEPPPHY